MVLINPLMRRLWVIVSLCLLMPTLLWAAPSRPFPQHVTYASGTIRPTNFTQTQQDQHVRDFYTYWKSRYLVSAGTNAASKTLYRVAFGQGSDVTVSEGQGFGMVIMALMAGYEADAQNLFDGLWYYSRQYPSGINKNLMSWKVQNGAMVGGNNNAFDGDIDIAYALLLAHNQWGSSGAVNYLAQAKIVIDAIMTSTIGRTSYLPKLGDWTSDNGSPYNQYTPRSSDFMTAHFRAFYEATQNAAWATVIQKTQAVIDSIQANYSSTTGLLPDFIINCATTCQPAYGGFLEGGNDGAYYYNAGRDPWRIGLDALLNNDAKSKAQALKMVRWVATNAANNASNIKAGYQLNGTPIGYYATSFFIAPLGVSAMLEASQQTFLNSIYALIYNKHETYYEDSVNMLNLLIITGNYWKPTSGAVTPAACADGVDNDQDGKIDYPQDPGCSSASDTDETDPITTQTLTVTKAGTGTGTVSSAPTGISCGTDCTEPYTTNTSVTLIATPASGSKFTSWSGACTGTATTCTLSMSAAKSVTATFDKVVTTQTLTVTKAGTGTGTVSSAPAGISCGTDCTEPYTTNTSVTLTATPASGSKFTSWSGACTGTATTCTLSMSAAKSVTATFDKVITTQTLTVTKAGTGTGTVSSAPAGISCGTDCTEPYATNTSVTLTAAPASGSKFTSWSGACTGTATTCTVSMSAAKSVTATFDKTSTQTVQVTLKTTNDWGTGYCSDVLIFNPTTAAVDWTITFNITGTIYNLWNAVYKQVGQQVTAEGVSWNNLVQPNQTLTFGFCANR